MADFLGTALTGLLSFQRALATTSHNIANVNTEGYSRQRVNLGTLPASSVGSIFVGSGVQVLGIQRVLDQIQVDELRGNITQQGRLDIFTQQSAGIVRLLANDDSGLSQPLQELFSGIQTVADSPSSVTARQVALSQANILADRIRTLQEHFIGQDGEVNARLEASMSEVNALAGSVADLNRAIAETSAAAGSNPPNDLLDQRDLVLRQLSELIATDVVGQRDGSVNVFIGNGLPLVLGSEASSLALVNSEFGIASKEIELVDPTGNRIETGALRGGAIGGLMDFRREVLDPSRNTLGQLATALTQTINAQHRQGMDLEGNLGGDLFSIGSPNVIPSAQNAGTGTISVSVSGLGSLSNSDYLLAFDGAAYTLTRRGSSSPIALSGTGTALDPFTAEGLSIVVGGAPAAGDKFLVRPTFDVAASFAVSLSKPEGFAAALPIIGTAPVTNAGDARIYGEEVLDVTDADLLDPVTIEFINATTYMVDGAGAFAYTEGGAIDVNGWRVRIEGLPVAGDQFTVRSNSGGVGDNRNALEVAAALERGVLGGGTTSVREGYANLVSEVSTTTRRSEINLTAQTAITDNAIAAQLAVSGVNLDEEAADLLRLQQAYQAAAQMVAVADTLFQALLAAVRR